MYLTYMFSKHYHGIELLSQSEEKASVWVEWLNRSFITSIEEQGSFTLPVYLYKIQ